MNGPIELSWHWGTSEGSRDFDRLNDRRMTFREKLEWLEEAETLTLRMRAAREKAKAERNCGPAAGETPG